MDYRIKLEQDQEGVINALGYGLNACYSAVASDKHYSTYEPEWGYKTARYLYKSTEEQRMIITHASIAVIQDKVHKLEQRPRHHVSRIRSKTTKG